MTPPMPRTSFPWLLAPLLLAACSATLKEENVGLEAEIEQHRVTERQLQDQVLELEHELDECQAAVDRKQVREVLAAAGVELEQSLFAEFVTSLGSFRVQLFPDLAPRTVANFVGLAEGTQPWIDPVTEETREGQRFYDGLIFHRVLPDYVIQTGDPTGRGTEGSGTPIPDEFSAELLHDRPGVLSMANSGPNTGESQVFVTLVAAPQLDGKHSAFGRVVSGLDVVEAISSVPTGAARPDRPDEDVVLERVEIIRGAAPAASAPPTP